MPRRLAPILLLIAFAALGTGLLENVHRRAHLLEHADAATAAHAEHDGHDDHDRHHESEESCQLCVNLHLPAISAGWVPNLVCLGLLVAFLTLLSPRLAPQRVALRIACRGPPAL